MMQHTEDREFPLHLGWHEWVLIIPIDAEVDDLMKEAGLASAIST